MNIDFAVTKLPVAVLGLIMSVDVEMRNQLTDKQLRLPVALLSFLLIWQLSEGKMMERRKKIALELSELVIYCRPVPFDEESKCRQHRTSIVLSVWCAVVE